MDENKNFLTFILKHCKIEIILEDLRTKVSIYESSNLRNPQDLTFFGNFVKLHSVYTETLRVSHITKLED